MVIYLLILKLSLVNIDLRKTVSERSLNPGKLKGAIVACHIPLIGPHFRAAIKSWCHHTLLIHVENFNLFVEILLRNCLFTTHYLLNFVLHLILELKHKE